MFIIHNDNIFDVYICIIYTNKRFDVYHPLKLHPKHIYVLRLKPYVVYTISYELDIL